MLNHIFTHQFGIEYLLVTELTELNRTNDFIINYSKEDIPNSLHIIPEDLLFQEGIEFWDMIFDAEHQVNILDDSTVQTLSFDIFAAVFYLLSRYEEYLFLENDEHNRFNLENSSLYKSECLNLPLVDIWIEEFKHCLISQFSLEKSVFKTKAFKVVPTVDIDSLFAFKGRSLWRQTGAFAKNILFFQFPQLFQRISVLLGMQKDPFDNFEEQFELWNTVGVKAHYFIHVGPYGKFDKNISHNHPYLKTIIHQIKAHGHSIGIHPSYQSNSDIVKVKSEITILEKLAEQPVFDSRQHFLKFTLPNTYRQLISNGIQKDFSMGYSLSTGFRAGTASSFFWFDLEKNEQTNLEIVPFCMMDVAYKNGLDMTIEESIEHSKTIIKTLKDYQLPLYFVIHNESMSEINGWKDWQTLFKTWFQ